VKEVPIAPAIRFTGDVGAAEMAIDGDFLLYHGTSTVLYIHEYRAVIVIITSPLVVMTDNDCSSQPPLTYILRLALWPYIVR